MSPKNALLKSFPFTDFSTIPSFFINGLMFRRSIQDFLVNFHLSCGNGHRPKSRFFYIAYLWDLDFFIATDRMTTKFCARKHILSCPTVDTDTILNFQSCLKNGCNFWFGPKLLIYAFCSSIINLSMSTLYMYLEVSSFLSEYFYAHVMYPNVRIHMPPSALMYLQKSFSKTYVRTKDYSKYT